MIRALPAVDFLYRAVGQMIPDVRDGVRKETHTPSYVEMWKVEYMSLGLVRLISIIQSILQLFFSR